MSVIKTKYEQRCSNGSDINQHLPKLYEYACKCETVAEFGVREVVSTYALAHARPKKLIFVDIKESPNVKIFLEECKTEGIDAHFFNESTLTFELEQVDMLFIDTMHTYPQLLKELERHHSKVNKYIIFHDTETWGRINEFVDTPNEPQGIMPALEQFLQSHPEWKTIYVTAINNGLTIIERS